MFIVGMSFQPILLLGITLIRDDRTTEIQGIPICIDYHFGRVHILKYGKRLISSKRLHQCSNLCSRIFKTSFHGIQLRRLYKRLVPLYIDYHIKVPSNLDASLITTVRTAFMMNRSHHHLTAESFHRLLNSFVISSHIRIIQNADYLFIHTLYHCFSAQDSQRFRRETGRGITGRYNSQKFHLFNR